MKLNILVLIFSSLLFGCAGSVPINEKTAPTNKDYRLLSKAMVISCGAATNTFQAWFGFGNSSSCLTIYEDTQYFTKRLIKILPPGTRVELVRLFCRSFAGVSSCSLIVRIPDYSESKEIVVYGEDDLPNLLGLPKSVLINENEPNNLIKPGSLG